MTCAVKGAQHLQKHAEDARLDLDILALVFLVEQHYASLQEVTLGVSYACAVYTFTDLIEDWHGFDVVKNVVVRSSLPRETVEVAVDGAHERGEALSRHEVHSGH